VAERGSALRQLIDRLGVAAFGVVVLTAERADRLADEIARRGAMSSSEARALVDDVTMRWRGGAADLGERAGASFQGVLRDLGLVTQDDFDELELRVAQLEHRLRLLEAAPAEPPALR
jgi:polyhydroxyalkanoate synthesis regulator phasin